jgi:large subunit ribosomal protein L23
MKNRSILNCVSNIQPLITEKAMKASEDSYVVFKAPKDVTKEIVTKAIEYLYKGTKVVKISSSLVKGKTKKFKGTMGKRADFKKFYIKLDKVIDITSEIK